MRGTLDVRHKQVGGRRKVGGWRMRKEGEGRMREEGDRGLGKVTHT